MKIQLDQNRTLNWKVRKIAVIGPGIVGMPMAALLADAKIMIGTDEPARVVVVQRNSKNSGWKVDAINAGTSVIGGIEPGLNEVVKNAVAEGILYATHDYSELSDADVILVCIQTDKKKDSFEPDYGPMFGGMQSLAKALQSKPSENIPLVVFESTLAPTSMTTVMREHFASYGLVEGENILLGNSPNRVMPGRLVERVTESDKLVAGLHPETPKMISAIYKHIVTRGMLHQTNSLTAEVTKTLENAYRDVRIAFSSEIVRYCDRENIDFYAVRDKVNQALSQSDTASTNPNAVPSGGILVPMVGVGGHCLPKDGILLWWRRLESGFDVSNSLILKAREMNDESPAETIALAERAFGSIQGKKVAVLGTAYRFNSEDTRNSPSIVLSKLLIERGCQVKLHDPYVKADDQNLLAFGVQQRFTNDIDEAIQDADVLIFATAHVDYLKQVEHIMTQAPKESVVVDGCNLYKASEIEKFGKDYAGIGRGKKAPPASLIQFVLDSFQAMEKGLANEVNGLCSYFNDIYASNDFNKVQFKEVQRLAASCNTGCEIVDAGPIEFISDYDGFSSILSEAAYQQYSLATES